jgi:hypothetical protein
MHRPADILQAVLKGVLAIGALATVLLALLIAWWVAALAITGWLVYAGVRRLFGGRRSDEPREDVPLIIEGEYRVEPEALPDAKANHRRDR